MISKFDKKTSVHAFSCDSPGCLANHEGEPGYFKQSWREAVALGWAYVPDYPDGVAIERHFCPEHAKKFDRVPTGGGLGRDPVEELIRKQQEKK